ncbi:hypothetical protein [Bergeyella sp. RCAD1439]|uniref:hypothetical protein n=1 Tax=Bergeyella anatis TaxID=3113737 RepID=UPI002E17C916|nr:hypothetical protein [Bergeyella sp. RCAD1439]
MKLIKISFFLLLSGLLAACTVKKESDKNKESVSSSMDSTKNGKAPVLFLSEWNGGREKPGFIRARGKTEYHSIYRTFKGGGGLTETLEALDSSVPELPKGHDAVFYSFGTMTSGSYTAPGIEALKIEHGVLKVYLKKTAPKDINEPQIMVLSRPWMVFSVPSDDVFETIEIK